MTGLSLAPGAGEGFGMVVCSCWGLNTGTIWRPAAGRCAPGHTQHRLLSRRGQAALACAAEPNRKPA
jgi:hypothetical protein